VPKVDIIITTYNELVENVVDTIAAAAAVDYPKDQFRVIVSDDGSDPKLKEQVQELATSFTNILYFARDKTRRSNESKHHGSKAGNLNDCIHFAKQLDNEPAEYFVCLDADMVPERDTLRALVAHVANSPKVAMVTLPQVSGPSCSLLDLLC
jgi:cellulose synthase/poly-beta-1,6-N-acetylglucosamine synthase-like glycosyltransferase